MAALDGVSSQVPTLGGLNGINGTGSSAPATAAAAAKTETAVASSATVVTDRTSVSSTGGLITQALNTSDVRLDKVAQLQAAIASGSYNVPSSDVAGKIVDNLLK